MSKMYRKNGSSWLEVKKGFKVKYGSGYIEPKQINYRYNGAWHKHAFETTVVFEGGYGYDAYGRRKGAYRELAYDGMTAIRSVFPSSPVLPYDVGGLNKNKLYVLNRSVFKEVDRQIQEYNPSTLTPIRTVNNKISSNYYGIAGSDDKLWLSYNFHEIHEYNPSTGVKIGSVSRHAETIGRFDETLVSWGLDASLRQGPIDDAFATTLSVNWNYGRVHGISGIDGRLFIIYYVQSSNQYIRAEVNPSTMTPINSYKYVKKSTDVLNSFEPESGMVLLKI
jgi:hypothetical protein